MDNRLSRDALLAAQANAANTNRLVVGRGSQLDKSPIVSALKALGVVSNQRNKDPVIAQLYAKTQSGQPLDPTEADIIRKAAISSAVNMIGSISGPAQKGKAIDDEYLAARRAIDATPIAQIAKESMRLTPTKAEFMKMTAVQREAIARLRAQALGQNTANWTGR